MAAADRVLEVAGREIGYTECISEGHRHTSQNHTRYGRWYGLDGEPWCAMFVSWCEHHAGFPLKVSTSRGYAYTPAGVAYFRRVNRWNVNDPRPGDHGFLYYPSLGRVGHVFLVERIDGTDVITIEGNTNGAGGREGGNVLRKRRRIRDCYGFGRPLRTGQEDDMPLNSDDLNRIREIVREEIGSKVVQSEGVYHEPRYTDLFKSHEAILEAIKAAGSGSIDAARIIDELAARLNR